MKTERFGDGACSAAPVAVARGSVRKSSNDSRKGFPSAIMGQLALGSDVEVSDGGAAGWRIGQAMSSMIGRRSTGSIMNIINCGGPDCQVSLGLEQHVRYPALSSGIPEAMQQKQASTKTENAQSASNGDLAERAGIP